MGFLVYVIGVGVIIILMALNMWVIEWRSDVWYIINAIIYVMFFVSLSGLFLVILSAIGVLS